MSVKWRDSMSVGVAHLDDDHQQLLDYLNRLEDALLNNAGASKQVAQVLLGVMQYTEEHFEREEQAMSAAGCRDLEVHRAEHLDLTTKARDLAHKYTQAPDGETAWAFYDLLSNWLTNHIIQRDVPEARYLKPYYAGRYIPARS